MNNAKKIEEFFGCHQGQPGVVMCSGPSLLSVDKEELYRFPTVAVNSSILHYPDCNYFISDDQDLKNWSYFTKDLPQSRCVKFLFGKKLGFEARRFRGPDVCLFDHTWWYDPSTGRKNLDGIVMENNKSGKLIGARSSAASAIHLLYLMGCCPILIVGMDGGLVNGKRYFWEMPDQPKVWRTAGGLPRGAMSMIIGKKELNEINAYWDEFCEANESWVGNIWNCCTTSTVGAFKKISWNDAMSQLRMR